MRFICAVMVFALHATLFGYFADTGASTKFNAAVSQGGFSAVVYFFILSGFILTWISRPGDRVSAFWRRRFFRIYPAYAIALLGGIVFSVVAQGSIADPVIAEGAVFDRTRIFLDVVMVQAWSPDVLVRTSFNQPLWSLSAEALMYLSFPLLLVLIRRVRPERLWAWVGGVVAAMFAVPAIVHMLPPGTVYPNFALTSNEVWLDLHFPATRLLDFVLGIFMARIVITGRRLPVGLGGAAALSATAYWLAAYVPLRFDVIALTALPLALFVAAAAVQDAAGRKSWISGRVWVWLGEISYSIYLLHFLVLMTARQLLGDRAFGTPAAFALVAVLFGVTVALAGLMHRFVEVPVMKRFSRSRRDREEQAEQAAAAEQVPQLEPADDERDAVRGRYAA